jgi:hypothetical protein
MFYVDHVGYGRGHGAAGNDVGRAPDDHHPTADDHDNRTAAAPDVGCRLGG